MAPKMRKGDVILFKGTGWISKAIGYVTRSPYSHSACYIGNGLIIEAIWSGVTISSIAHRYNGVSYSVYRHVSASPPKLQLAIDMMLKQEGKGYDYKGLVGILVSLFKKEDINRLQNKSLYWCHELIMDHYHLANLPTRYGAETSMSAPSGTPEDRFFRHVGDYFAE